MIQPSDAFTLTEFKRKSDVLIKKLKTSGRPHVLTVEGAPTAVIMSVGAFEEMAELAEKAATLAKIRQGLEEVKASGSKLAADVFETLRKQFDTPKSR